MWAMELYFVCPGGRGQRWEAGTFKDHADTLCLLRASSFWCGQGDQEIIKGQRMSAVECQLIFK